MAEAKKQSIDFETLLKLMAGTLTVDVASITVDNRLFIIEDTIQRLDIPADYNGPDSPITLTTLTGHLDTQSGFRFTPSLSLRSVSNPKVIPLHRIKHKAGDRFWCLARYDGDGSVPFYEHLLLLSKRDCCLYAAKAKWELQETDTRKPASYRLASVRFSTHTGTKAFLSNHPEGLLRALSNLAALSASIRRVRRVAYEKAERVADELERRRKLIV